MSPAEGDIVINEAAREVGPPVVVQVHRQESNLRGDIAVSEAVIELDTVIDTDAVIKADVGGVEVAVAVPYPAALPPAGGRDLRSPR